MQQRVIIPAFAALAAFVLVVLVAVQHEGDDGSKVSTKPPVTTTTTSSSTSSTTSTSTTTSTTTTVPEDGSDDCKDKGGFGHLSCMFPEPDDPGTPTNEQCSVILGSEVCVPKVDVGDTSDPPPGTGDTTACENGEVTSAFRWFSQQEGKAAPNNFGIDPTSLPADPAIDLTDPEAGGQLLALMQYQSCLDPARLVADLVASDLVKTRDETELNRFVEELKSDTKLRKEWYRKLVRHREEISETYVWKSNGKPFRTMDMLNNSRDKTYPQLKFTEGKGSCTHILVLVFNDGHTEVYCVECDLQPRWEHPPAAPPKEKPPCNCKKPPAPKPPAPKPPAPKPPAPKPPAPKPPKPKPPKPKPPKPKPKCPPPYQHIPVPPGGVGECPKDKPEEGTTGD